MKNTFQFRSRLTTYGENLTQPVNFLPSEMAFARSGKEVFQPELENLPVFGGFLSFKLRKNMMAQPLLNGGLQ